jgi:hypothetical protein
MGLYGMQSALVLFGYDIEQQVKRIYNRENISNEPNIGRLLSDESQYALEKKRRFHNILWTYPHDIRGFVYLAVAGLMHGLIWSSIIM